MADEERAEHERLVQSLNDVTVLEDYKRPYDTYRVGLVARVVGGFLVGCGNMVYGHGPSYLKFRAIEVIARVPYHSWTSALFTLLTLFYSNEGRALRLSALSRFAHFSAENETMHVIVISHLSRAHERAGAIRHTLIPMLFAFVYFWLSYLLYLVNPRYSLEINYLFEQHAFDQYSQFLAQNEAMLRNNPVESAYLNWYGRTARSEYEFFQSVRNDEIIHRNRSIHEIELHCSHGKSSY